MQIYHNGRLSNLWSDVGQVSCDKLHVMNCPRLVLLVVGDPQSGHALSMLTVGLRRSETI